MSRWAWAMVLAAGCSSSTADSGSSDGGGGTGGTSVDGSMGDGSTSGGGGEDAGRRQCPEGLRCPTTEPGSPFEGVPYCDQDGVDISTMRCNTGVRQNESSWAIRDPAKGGTPRFKNVARHYGRRVHPGETVEISGQYVWLNGDIVEGVPVRATFLDVHTESGEEDPAATERSYFGSTITPDEALPGRLGTVTFFFTAGPAVGKYTILLRGDYGGAADVEVVVSNNPGVDAGPP